MSVNLTDVDKANLVNEMKVLNEKLKVASDKYYNEGISLISDAEFDTLRRKLEQLEKATGVILPDSIAHHVGATPDKALKSVKHEYPALSLKDTQDINDLTKLLSANQSEGVLSWKEDGLTLQITYLNGTLQLGATRGDGIVGNDITANVCKILNLPKTISYKDKLIVRGEGLISFSAFDALVQKAVLEILAKKNPAVMKATVQQQSSIVEKYLEENKPPFRLPRSLASGTLMSKDSTLMDNRPISFKVFELVYPKVNSYKDSLDFLKNLGFDVVEYRVVTPGDISSVIQDFSARRSTYPYPTDGLVLQINDLVKARILGFTEKHSRSAFAYKWAEEVKDTVLQGVNWSISKQGTLTPVAHFKQTLIGGSYVSNATLSNLNIFRSLKLSVGCKLKVCKAKEIVPSIVSAEPIPNAPLLPIPTHCPYCKAPTRIVTNDKTDKLVCTNNNCISLLAKKIAHFVSKDCMDMDGLGEGTISTLVSKGYLTSYVDLFHLKERTDIKDLEGFGEKSYLQILQSVDKGRKAPLNRFLQAFAIPRLGNKDSLAVAKFCKYNFNTFFTLVSQRFDWQANKVIGAATQSQLYSWFSNNSNANLMLEVSKYINFIVPEETVAPAGIFSGKTFCLSGPPKPEFSKKEEVEQFIVSRGGTMLSGVSKKLDYLVCQTKSTKSEKAKDLGVTILSCAELIKMGNSQ